jgi:hypothetical protein
MPPDEICWIRTRSHSGNAPLTASTDCNSHRLEAEMPSVTCNACKPRAASSRDRIARHRARQRTWAARVVLWLPDVNDPGFWAQLADECRRLARLTREEEAIVAGFARLVSWTE